MKFQFIKKKKVYLTYRWLFLNKVISKREKFYGKWTPKKEFCI